MNIVRTIRCLDGVFYSTLALLILLLHPGLGKDVLGGLDLFCVAPAFAVAWFCLVVPLTPGADERWRRMTLRLRISSLAMAGLSPFVVWWLRRPEDNYLLINSMLCLLATAYTVFFLALLCVEIGRYIGRAAVMWEGRLVAAIVFWLLLVVGYGGIVLILLITWLFFGEAMPGRNLATIFGFSSTVLGLDLRSRMPGLMGFFIWLAPVIFLLTLLVRTRYALMRYLQETLKEQA